MTTTTPTRPQQPATQATVYNEYQTKAELMRTFGRGETYMTNLLDDLEAYDNEHPETYQKVSILSLLSDSNRLYYNVFVVNHFVGNKLLLEMGRSDEFNYKDAVEHFHSLTNIQNDLSMYQKQQEFYERNE